MTEENLEKIVESLNADLYERLGEKMYSSHPLSFSYTSNGDFQLIEMEGLYIWDSENDDREYINKEEWIKEDLEKYAWKQIEAYRNIFNKLLDYEKDNS